jgi:YggT family protein
MRSVLIFVLDVYTFVIIARALLSWIPHNPYGEFSTVLRRVTEPVLAPLRKRIPLIAGSIDVSPVVALVGLQIVKRIIVAL